MKTFSRGDEVVVVNYPDKHKDVVGCTGVVEGWNGLYWEVLLDSYGLEDERDPVFLFKTQEINLVDRKYNYNPDQTGDTDEDI